MKISWTDKTMKFVKSCKQISLKKKQLKHLIGILGYVWWSRSAIVKFKNENWKKKFLIKNEK